MKITFFGKILAFCFVMLIVLMTIQYLATNWSRMTDWYKTILIGSSFIIISGLIVLAVGGKEISRTILLTLPIGILLLDMIKAASSREGLNDSSLIWFKYSETLPYSLKLMWHAGLDLFVYVMVIFLKYLPGRIKA